jgi:hypothetical protein
MKTIRDSHPDPGGNLSTEEVARTLRAYSMLGGVLDKMASDRPMPVSIAATLLKTEPSGWRSVAQMIGALCGRAQNGIDGFEEMTGAAQPLVAAENWDEFKRVAYDCATLEALRAWQWAPRESWKVAREQIPWLERASAWLGRRSAADLVEFEGYAAFCIGQLSHSASHDVLCSAVVGSHDAIPESHRDRVARLVREKLSELSSALLINERRGGTASIDQEFLLVLESIGSEGKQHAEAIRQDIPDRVKEHGTVSYGWLPSVSPVSPPRRLATLAIAVWRDVVEPEIERKSRKENEPARISMQLANTASIGRLHGAKRDGSAIMVEPPRGIALLLDFDGIQVSPPKEAKRTNGLVNLRTILDGASLRDYLAHSIQWLDAGAPPDGLFSSEDEEILEMTGATKHVETKNGRHYERFATKSRQSLLRHRLIYQAIRVRQVGNIEAAAGDVLLDEIRDRLEGKRRWFAHSRLMTHHMLNDYARIPRAVCRLKADDVPTAIAIGMLVRDRVVGYANGKSIEAPLADLAEKSGVDLTAGIRKHGPRYAEAFADNAVRITGEGQIGSARVSGHGRNATITIDPSDSLRDSYAPLVEVAASRGRAKKAAMVRAAMKPKKT